MGSETFENREAWKEDCTLCPRNCHVNRGRGERGFCAQTDRLRVARAALHFWEEPCISGTAGSGTVFFCGCNLRCVFCQNREISRGDAGKEICPEELADLFLRLQEQKAHNINLVTPSHFVPGIVRALERARVLGLHIPVVYNTGSYEKAETLRLLDGLVDIYLPDFKYYSARLSARYSGAADYFQIACAAVAEMVRQAPEPVFETTDEGTELMKKGVLVRHLILPGCTADSKEVIRSLYETYGNRIYLSIMNQYTPMPGLEGCPELGRRVTRREYEKVLSYALELGVENGFFQEGKTAEESFIPPFDGTGL